MLLDSIKALIGRVYDTLNTKTAFILLVLVQFADWLLPDSGNRLLNTVLRVFSRVFLPLMLLVLVIALISIFTKPSRHRFTRAIVYLVAITACFVFLLRPSPKVREAEEVFIPPLEYPDLSLVLSHIPEQSVVEGHDSEVEPADVQLDYRNESGVDLVLFMFDCSKYYRNEDPWVQMSMPANQSNPTWKRFADDSTGYFSFVVRDERKGIDSPIKAKQIFNKKVTRLTVVQAEPAIKVEFD